MDKSHWCQDQWLQHQLEIYAFRCSSLRQLNQTIDEIVNCETAVATHYSKSAIWVDQSQTDNKHEYNKTTDSENKTNPYPNTRISSPMHYSQNMYHITVNFMHNLE